MKYYKINGEVFAFESDGSQDDFIKPEMSSMTPDEVDRYINPEKYMSAEEKQRLVRERMPTLSPIKFDIKLNNAGLYDTVQDLIKDNFELRIAYNRATFFSRTDPFIEQARIALGLTDAQVDTLWVQQDQQPQP